ncbi:MAG: folate-binding protein [Stenomitos rutilans HA7619-LM2]|nr:folate-binding protein [Stenomitos rutilans HA7619-LM2]
MTESLRAIQKHLGAEFEEPVSVPVSFGNDVVALQAARSGVAVCDRTHWGRIQLTGADRLNFLHNQSTNDFKRLKPGQGCDTVFVTSTARTIDLATAYILEDAVLVLVSPNRHEQLLKWLDRYIFFGDQVTLTNVTEQTASFSLIGSKSSSLLKQLGIEIPANTSYGSHWLTTLAGQPVRIGVGSGLALEGYTLTTDNVAAAPLWTVLVETGATPLGDRVWERLRIEQGRPAPDHELTEDYNPLEAGLWQTISFDKGCYIGQETIARLDTYKGVKQQLWGIRLKHSVAPGTPITLQEEKVGMLTSSTETAQGAFGLAYIRTKAGGAGLQVQVGETGGEVVDVPFVTRDRVSKQP